MSKGIEGSNPSLTASFLVKSRSEFESASFVVTSGLLWRTKCPRSVSSRHFFAVTDHSRSSRPAVATDPGFEACGVYWWGVSGFVLAVQGITSLSLVGLPQARPLSASPNDSKGSPCEKAVAGDSFQVKAIDSAALVPDDCSGRDKESIIAKRCAHDVTSDPSMLLVLAGPKCCLVCRCSRVRAAESGVDSG